MNALLTVRTLQDLEPDTDAETAQLQARALEHAGLAAGDFLTVRDLLEYGGCRALPLRALLLILFMEFNAGSLCLRLTAANLRRKLRQLTGEDREDLVAAILEGLDTEQWSGIIARDSGTVRPLLEVEIGGDRFLYFQKTWVQARQLKERLQARLAQAEDNALAAAGDVLKEVLNDDGLPFALNREQQLAVALALLRRFLIVSGGPGTGKTSIVVALLRAMVRLGLDAGEIALVAPTGRAAQRLTEAIHGILANPTADDLDLLQIAGQTIHRLLKYNPAANRFRYNEHYPLPLRLLVVDEVSMVDVHLMERLLAAVPPDTHLVFLGDKDQLPSVDAGAVLADLIPADVPEAFTADALQAVAALLPELELPEPAAADGPLHDAIVMLKSSYRSEQGIMALAAAVNTRSTAELELAMLTPEQLRTELPTATGAWLLPETSTPAGLQAGLDQWAIQFFLRDAPGGSFRERVARCEGLDWKAALTDARQAEIEALFDRLQAAQILSLVRRGPFGAGGINRYLDRELRRVFDPKAAGRTFSGVPIIIQQNDRSKELYNGDVGIVLRDAEGELRAVFRRLGQFIHFGVDNLPPYELAYAITVHKSQGSEYERVLLVLPNRETHRLLSKEILYTGLTRAKTAVYIAGRKEVLTAGVRRHIARETGISLWADGAAASPPELPPAAAAGGPDDAGSDTENDDAEAPPRIAEAADADVEAPPRVAETPPESLPDRTSKAKHKKRQQKDDDDDRQLKLFDF